MQTPASSVHNVVAEMRQIHTDYLVLWRKRDSTATLSRGEPPILPLTGFYCFSGHITLTMVLIYYAQVRFRWLLFTENKGEDVANYSKKKGRIFTNVKGKVVGLVTLVLGSFSIDFRKLL